MEFHFIMQNMCTDHTQTLSPREPHGISFHYAKHAHRAHPDPKPKGARWGCKTCAHTTPRPQTKWSPMEFHLEKKCLAKKWSEEKCVVEKMLGGKMMGTKILGEKILGGKMLGGKMLEENAWMKNARWKNAWWKMV